MPDVQDVVRGRVPDPKPQAGPVEPAPSSPPPARRRRRRIGLLIGGAAALAALSSGALSAFAGHTEPVPVEHQATRIEIVTDSEGVDLLSTNGDRATIASPTLFGDNRGEVRQSFYGDTLRLQLECRQWGCRRDFQVAVPAGVTVSTRLTSGSLDARDVGGSLDVRSTSGSVDLQGVRGDVTVESTSGSIDVANVSGKTRLRSSSGSLEVTGAGGEVSAQSDSGSIDVEGVRGETRLRSSSGSMDVSGVDGDVTAESTSGGIEVEDFRGGRLSLKSTSGSIDAQATSELQRLRAESSSGSIDLRVPGGKTYSVMGESGSGSRDVDVQQDVRGVPLFVRTGSGSVDIEEG